MPEVMESKRGVEDIKQEIEKLEAKIQDMVRETEEVNPETQANLQKQIADFRGRVEELKVLMAEAVKEETNAWNDAT